MKATLVIEIEYNDMDLDTIMTQAILGLNHGMSADMSNVEVADFWARDIRK